MKTCLPALCLVVICFGLGCESRPPACAVTPPAEVRPEPVAEVPPQEDVPVQAGRFQMRMDAEPMRDANGNALVRCQLRFFMFDPGETEAGVAMSASDVMVPFDTPVELTVGPAEAPTFDIELQFDSGPSGTVQYRVVYKQGGEQLAVLTGEAKDWKDSELEFEVPVQPRDE